MPGLRADELACFLFVRPRRGGRRQPAPAAQPGQPAQPQRTRPPSRRPRPPAPAQPLRPCSSRPGLPAPLRGQFGQRPRRLGCPAPTGRVPAAVSGARPGLRAAAVSAGPCAHGPEVKSELDSEMCGVNNATAWPVLQRGHIPFRLALAMSGGRRWLLFAAPQRLDARHPAFLHPRRSPGRGRGIRLTEGVAQLLGGRRAAGAAGPPAQLFPARVCCAGGGPAAPRSGPGPSRLARGVTCLQSAGASLGRGAWVAAAVLTGAGCRAAACCPTANSILAFLVGGAYARPGHPFILHS